MCVRAFRHPWYCCCCVFLLLLCVFNSSAIFYWHFRKKRRKKYSKPKSTPPSSLYADQTMEKMMVLFAFTRWLARFVSSLPAHRHKGNAFKARLSPAVHLSVFFLNLYRLLLLLHFLVMCFLCVLALKCVPNNYFSPTMKPSSINGFQLTNTHKKRTNS